MKTACIVPSAGKGRRLNLRQDKPFLMLCGKPLLFYTLKALERSDSIDYIVLAVSGDKLKMAEKLIKKYALRKVRAIVAGGKRRFNSVKNALSKVRDADFVLIHDGARPFIDRNLIKRVIHAAKREGAAVAAIPSTETLKSVNRNSFVANTPDRKYLWAAQTPQAFRKDLIVGAYKKAKNRKATDDSMLAEDLGHKVRIVRGSHRNIKVTTPEDLELAKVLVKSERNCHCEGARRPKQSQRK